MPLLSYDPMEDGESASANLWNVRLSAIHDLLNGNLDAANLANGAVTTPKLADGAVTSAKIAITQYIDDNGWTVNDYGTNKQYSKRIEFSGGSVFGIKSADNLPVGLVAGSIKYAHITAIIDPTTGSYTYPRGVVYGFLDWEAGDTTYQIWAASTLSSQSRTASSAIITLGD